MADPKDGKSSFIGGLVDKAAAAGSRFVDSVVAKGREGMEEQIAKDGQKQGLTGEQQQELRDRTARNARLKNTMGQ